MQGSFPKDGGFWRVLEGSGGFWRVLEGSGLTWGVGGRGKGRQGELQALGEAEPGRHALLTQDRVAAQQSLLDGAAERPRHHLLFSGTFYTWRRDWLDTLVSP